MALAVPTLIEYPDGAFHSFLNSLVIELPSLTELEVICHYGPWERSNTPLRKVINILQQRTTISESSNGKGDLRTYLHMLPEKESERLKRRNNLLEQVGCKQHHGKTKSALEKQNLLAQSLLTHLLYSLLISEFHWWSLQPEMCQRDRQSKILATT